MRQPKWDVAKQSGRWETEIFSTYFFKGEQAMVLNVQYIIEICTKLFASVKMSDKLGSKFFKDEIKRDLLEIKEFGGKKISKCSCFLF